MSAANTGATCRRDASGCEHTIAGPDARIVSLVPSITELLFDLGLGGQVVGRTGFCIHPRSALGGVVKLGGTKDVDLDGLRALAPTHVVVNIDENTRATYDALCSMGVVVIVTHPLVPQDNLALYRLLGSIFQREAKAEDLCLRFEQGLERMARSSAEWPTRRVLYLIWREPWMTVTPATYIAATLALVRWQTVPLHHEQRYPSLTAAAMAALAPDLCLLSSEPYPFRDKHVAEVRQLLGGGTPVRLVDGEMLSWYGSRAVAGLDYLADFAGRELETIG